MFAERFDALMKIAEVSNSLLGRNISMNSSHIGRLRSGSRPLPKEHGFITPTCRYLARHITGEQQLNALVRLTNIGGAALTSEESMAQYLEEWLLERESDTFAAAGRLISGFARLADRPAASMPEGTERPPEKYAAYLYGNAGKRRAVEQFFLMILQEERPRTLLLFSDEDMAWLYEDAAFAQRWKELFTRVILKGNRVRIIHTVSRNMNELLEAVMKWVPIYMTGAIEPFFYPRLRDGVFQRTMFIAPGTAAVISSCVGQKPEGMLNLFITDRAAVTALEAEYERYFAMCRPLMRIFTGKSAPELLKTMDSLSAADGDACLISAMPTLFAMPAPLAAEIAEQTGSDTLLPLWKKSLSTFRRQIKKQRLSLTVLDREVALLSPDALPMPMAELFSAGGSAYTPEQYQTHFDALLKMETRYDNLRVTVRADIAPNTLLYAKEDVGAVMAKTDAPFSAFVMGEKNMINAFWDYMSR